MLWLPDEESANTAKDNGGRICCRRRMGLDSNAVADRLQGEDERYVAGDAAACIDGRFR
jgi:hypothetical protein